jgi:2,4-dienoyl-CoA reductase-like NADH-dependent reductase (Old Yellow Enzyme family)
LRLGLDAIEIHSAHGYLLHEFLSPLSNKRDDAYGGSLANRMLFPLEVFEVIRATVPERIPLGVRFSAPDWVDGGWDIEQSLAYCHELAKRGCSFFDVSSGGLSSAQKIPAGPGYQVVFAEAVKRETKIPTMAVGMITEPGQAETIIRSGQADMVSLARGILYDPRWPWHAAADLGATVEAPSQYLRSQPATLRQLLRPRGTPAG